MSTIGQFRQARELLESRNIHIGDMIEIPINGRTMRGTFEGFLWDGHTLLATVRQGDVLLGAHYSWAQPVKEEEER